MQKFFRPKKAKKATKAQHRKLKGLTRYIMSNFMKSTRLRGKSDLFLENFIE